jgi:hypothetical protein
MNDKLVMDGYTVKVAYFMSVLDRALRAEAENNRLKEELQVFSRAVTKLTRELIMREAKPEKEKPMRMWSGLQCISCGAVISDNEEVTHICDEQLTINGDNHMTSNECGIDKQYASWSTCNVTEEWVRKTNDCDRMKAAFEGGMRQAINDCVRLVDIEYDCLRGSIYALLSREPE